jgi:hypothetical protein
VATNAGFSNRPSVWFIGGALILAALATALRFPFADWDGGHQLHPDERAILFVAEDITLNHPNPFHAPDGQVQPYPYGHLPLYLEAAAGWLLDHVRIPCAPDTFCGRLTDSGGAGPFTHLTYVGRALSALYDTVTVLATVLLARQLMGANEGPLLAGGMVALAVLHIQNAHFGTVDTALTLFCTLAVGATVRASQISLPRASVMAGIWTGLAIGSKASGVLLALPLALAHLETQPRLHMNRRFGLSALAALIAFLATNPLVVLDPVPFARAWATQVAVMHGWIDWPFVRQYIGTLPVVYVIEQQARWALGLPLTLAAYIGLGWAGWQAWKARNRPWSIPVVWAAAGLLAFGPPLVKFPRYMLPFTPTLAACAAGWVASQRRALRVALGIGVLAPTAVYALAFVNMYRDPHPWVAASEWIYENIPPDAVIAVEYWDDPLPLPLHRQTYTSVVLNPFDEPDNEAKLAALLANLSEADYLILSSNRLYSTIPRLGRRYPLTGGYYRALFAGEMGFRFERAFFRYPQLGGIALVDDPFRRAGLTAPPIDWPEGMVNLGFADESFTVYDHPLVLIFRRMEPPE